MTITIEVSEEVREKIARESEETGLPIEAIAAARVAAWYASGESEEQDDPEAIEAIQEGLEDIATGRTVGLDDYRREMRARHAAGSRAA